MKKMIFLSVVFSIYACANQGNERNENIPTMTGGGDTTIVVDDADRANNTGIEVNDTSTTIGYDTAVRRRQTPANSGGTR